MAYCVSNQVIIYDVNIRHACLPGIPLRSFELSSMSSILTRKSQILMKKDASTSTKSWVFSLYGDGEGGGVGWGELRGALDHPTPLPKKFPKIPPFPKHIRNLVRFSPILRQHLPIPTIFPAPVLITQICKKKINNTPLYILCTILTSYI